MSARGQTKDGAAVARALGRGLTFSMAVLAGLGVTNIYYN